MRLSAGDRFAVCVAFCAAAMAACGGSGSARPAVTIAPLTPATEAAVVHIEPLTPARTATVLLSPTALPEHCPEPFVTPLPPSPTPEATATELPDGVTPEPTPPIRLPHAFDVPQPAPSVTPVALRSDAALERAIRARLGDDAPHYAIVIKDVRDGRGVAIEPDRIFYAASLFKLEVMYEVFHQRDAGTLSFDEEYIASDYYAGFDLGPHRIQLCEKVSIGDALAAMLSVSDNVAAVMLQDRAGAGNINNAMAALGLEETRLTEDGSLPATAADMARLLETIALGGAVSEAASNEMALLMATEEIDDRIPHHLPKGTIVAHKTGNWETATHDAGIVYGKRSTYVMVLMSDIGFDGDAGSVEADIAKIAWDHLEGQ